MDYKNLIEQLRKHHQSWAAYSDLELAHALEDAITAIENLLAEREAVVKHGEWIDKGWDGDFSWRIDGRGNCWKVIECSVCGEPSCGSTETPFCPYCGAKMNLQRHSQPPDRQQAES